MIPIKVKQVNTRAKYNETFKREAVNNWLFSGKSAEVGAEELGLKTERIYSWSRRFAPLLRWSAPRWPHSFHELER